MAHGFLEVDTQMGRAERLMRTPQEATRFFVDRIVTEAAAGGHPLSDLEVLTLSWSESDPDAAATMARLEQSEEALDEKFESKIIAILKRCYAHDVAADGTARQRYREAYAAVSQADGYLAVMLSPVLGTSWASWPTVPRIAARISLVALLLVPGTMAILMALGVLVAMVSSGVRTTGSILGGVAGASLLAVLGTCLLMLWRRESRG